MSQGGFQEDLCLETFVLLVDGHQLVPIHSDLEVVDPMLGLRLVRGNRRDCHGAGHSWGKTRHKKDVWWKTGASAIMALVSCSTSAL